MSFYVVSIRKTGIDNNYSYDEEGRLIMDLQEGIDEIIWRVDGKVKEIVRSTQSNAKNVKFDYDAMGLRIAKHVLNNQTGVLEKSTYYILDAQGNTVSVYEHEVDNNQVLFNLKENHIFGTSRLGVLNQNVNMYNTSNSINVVSILGNKSFELTDHRGNVNVVISNIKVPQTSNTSTVSSYIVNILRVSDYSGFGVQLEGRTFNSATFSYGFNGMRKDDEISGSGNHYTAMFWEYDPRLGRRWNVDPIVKVHEAPYACFANNPVFYIDPNGADKIKFDEDGNYVSGEKKGKFHEFLFGSKGSVVDKEGNTVREFKFNDKKAGQVENFEGEEPLYSGIDLTFEGKIEEITDLATTGAPSGSIFNKEKREWIKNASSDIVNGGTGNSPLDFLGTNVDWGGDGFTTDRRIRIVGDKAYDDFDAGNLLWGRAMQKLDIGILVSRLGAHANAFMYGKMQYAQTNRKGEDIEFTEEDRKKFSLRQITWTGDSRLDQKAIRHGHRIGRKLN